MRRLRTALDARAGCVFNSEHRKLQLLTWMDSRRSEVEAHREILTAHLKVLHDDVHRAAREAGERRARRGALENKHAILVAKMKIHAQEEEEDEEE